MEVLVATNPNGKNPYVDLIFNEINKDEGINIVLSVDSFWESSLIYDIVHIQWPEALFYWKPITSDMFKRFQERIEELKGAGTKIFCTRHNEYAHNELSYQKLYDYIYIKADSVVHLGDYSRKKLGRKNRFDVVIPHPLYQNLKSIVPLEPDYKESPDQTLLSVGELRHFPEFMLMVKPFLFRSSSVKGARLVLCNYLSLFERKHSFFKRKKASRLIHSVLSFFFRPFNIVLMRGSLSDKDLVGLLSESHILLVPRERNLNSGLIFLGVTFGLKLIAPDVGNITEYMKEAKQRLFKSEPSFKDAIKKALKDETPDYNGLQEKLSPDSIAKSHIDLYQKIFEDMI